MVTIDEIAKKAGVAKSTVSRYLNQGSVSEKTKEKIAQVIEKTDYQPNLYAQSLKAKNTNMIGVVIPRLNSASTNDALTGIDHEAKKNGYEPIILNSDLNLKNDVKNIQILNKQKVEGIIFFASELNTEIIQAVQQSYVPILLVGQTLKGTHSITHEDYNAGYIMGQHVLKMGHKQALFFGVSEKDEAVGVQRKNGFFDAFKKGNGQSLFIKTSFSKSETYHLAKKELPLFFHHGITIIGCATDNIALAVMKALTDLGKNVPEDFSLFGFGGYDIMSYLNPTITTIRYPYYNIGQESVNYLLNLVKNKKIKAMNIKLPNELVSHESIKKINNKK